MHTPLPEITTPKRVVSLVPSITESLYDLGLGQCLVGITDYCVYPRGLVDLIPKVGGPKTIDVERIVSLRPDLILANREENKKEEIEKLIGMGYPVWLAHPISVQDSFDDLRGLAGLFYSDSAMLMIRALEDSLEWLTLSMLERTKFTYFCPIWRRVNIEGKNEWMVFRQNTYMNDLLSLFGGENVFAYPQNGGGDEKEGNTYPYILSDLVVQRKPDLIILPDEPYAFTNKDGDELKRLFEETEIDMEDRIVFLDGSLITWQGTRIAKAFNTLPNILTL